MFDIYAVFEIIFYAFIIVFVLVLFIQQRIIIDNQKEIYRLLKLK